MAAPQCDTCRTLVKSKLKTGQDGTFHIMCILPQLPIFKKAITGISELFRRPKRTAPFPSIWPVQEAGGGPLLGPCFPEETGLPGAGQRSPEQAATPCPVTQQGSFRMGRASHSPLHCLGGHQEGHEVSPCQLLSSHEGAPNKQGAQDHACTGKGPGS